MKKTKCMGWHGRYCEQCARLARDKMDEVFVGVEREDTIGTPCPRFDIDESQVTYE